jgi:small neutral amino acid transporter SnatA (MarC family)
MTTMVLLHSQARGNFGSIIAIELALVLALLLTLGALVFARYVARLLGDTGSRVVGRVYCSRRWPRRLRWTVSGKA